MDTVFDGPLAKPNEVLEVSQSNYLAGDYESAVIHAEDALKLAHKVVGDDLNNLLKFIVNLGSCYEEIGDISKAEALYSNLLHSLNNNKKINNYDYISVEILFNVGDFYGSISQYERAEILFKEALNSLDNIKDKDSDQIFLEELILYELLQIYIKEGRTSEAAICAKKVLTLENTRLSDAKNYQTPFYDLSLHHKRLGEIDLLNRDYKAAVNNFNESILNFSKQYKSLSKKLSAYAVEAEQGLVIACMGLNDNKQAYNKLKNILQVSNHVIDSVTFNSTKYASEPGGLTESKLRYFLSSLPFRIEDQLNLIMSFYTKHAIDQEEVKKLAFTAVIQRKGILLERISSEQYSVRQFAAPHERVLLDSVNYYVSELSHIFASGNNNPSRKAIRKWQLGHILEENLSAAIAHKRSTKTTITLDSVRRWLPPNSGVLEFVLYKPYNLDAKGLTQVWGEPRYEGFFMNKSGAITSYSLGSVASIDSLIIAWRSALKDPDNSSVDSLGRTVYQKVIAPLMPNVSSMQHLFISPDGLINTIPFASLIDNNNRFLIDNYTISYLENSRELANIIKKTGVNIKTTEPVIVANPSFTISPKTVREDSLNWTNLIHTSAEANSIKKIVPSAILYTKQDANESQIKKIANPAFLHIATHGYISPIPVNDNNEKLIHDYDDLRLKKREWDNPMYKSGLVLAGANDSYKIGNDGYLTAAELATIDLRGTELVTLSACETGLGTLTNGEGVYGLKRALFIAGAKNIVVSLWQVSDSATTLLMNSFYTYLRKGEGVAKALRLAQIEMKNNSSFNHPYYWAGFSVFGGTQNLVGLKSPSVVNSGIQVDNKTSKIQPCSVGSDYQPFAAVQIENWNNYSLSISDTIDEIEHDSEILLLGTRNGKMFEVNIGSSNNKIKNYYFVKSNSIKNDNNVNKRVENIKIYKEQVITVIKDVTTFEYSIVAFSKKTRAIIWSTPVPYPSNTVHPLIISNNIVVWASADSIIGLDYRNGHILWKSILGDGEMHRSEMVARGDVIIIVSSRKSDILFVSKPVGPNVIYQISISDGKVLSRYDLGTINVSSEIVNYNDNIIFLYGAPLVESKKGIVSISIKTGAINWKITNPNSERLYRPKLVIYNSLLITTDKKGLTAFNVNTGEFMWRYATFGRETSSPVLNNDQIFFFADEMQDRKELHLIFRYSLITGCTNAFKLKNDISSELYLKGNELLFSVDFKKLYLLRPSQSN
ncbi:CHAT domain-containing protein [Hymenobacter volaticus]|uniref:CHAT domain-containing protein n=1 Tax=Hymenobacter volaticus TaxID=2932254 RepID=A0ABY4G7D6_9BACT|nr:CHAT domain-containing protein [Hymenobacter volaticus]UOQ66801.1 CHAT domain-containing protein [Hymenobacter volaticus]